MKTIINLSLHCYKRIKAAVSSRFKLAIVASTKELITIIKANCFIFQILLSYTISIKLLPSHLIVKR